MKRVLQGYRTPLFLFVVLLLALALSSGVFAVDLNNSVSNYWKFDETSGTKAVDSVTGVNNITLTNGATFNTSVGIINGSMNATSGSDYGDFTTEVTVNTTNIWVRPTTAFTNQFILTRGAVNNCLFGQGGVLKFSATCSNGDANFTGFTLPTDSWTMITLVHNGSGILAYRNGTFISYVAVAAAPIFARVGYTNSQSFEGYHDELGVWSRPLNASEVANLYALQAARVQYPFIAPVVITTVVLGVNDTRTGSLVSGFTVNVSNSTYSQVYSTGQTTLNLTPGSTNTTNSTLYLPLINATFFNGSAQDYSPNAIQATLQGRSLTHGTLIGGTTPNTTGLYGSGMQFDGINDRIDTITGVNITESFTMCIQGNLNSNGTSSMLALGSPPNAAGGNGVRFQVTGPANLTAVQVFNSSQTALFTMTVASARAVNPAAWNYYCFGFNGTNFSIATNGTWQFFSNSISQIDTTYNFSLGRGAGSVLFWNGTQDGFRYWRAWLNNTEITSEMNSGMPVRGKDLNLSYSFELNNISAGGALNATADTNYLVNGSAVSEGAYYFDGIDDILTTSPFVYDSNSFANGMTFSYWANPLSLSQRIRPINHQSNVFYSYLTTGSQYLCIFQNTTNQDNSRAITVSSPVGQWYSITCVYNQTHVLAYVNGVLNGNSPFVGELRKNNNSIRVGVAGSSSAEFWNGSIANVYVYPRSLSAQEVMDLYRRSPFSAGIYNLSFTNVSNGTYFNVSLLNQNLSTGNVVYGNDWSNYINFTLKNLLNQSNLASFTVSVSNGSSQWTQSTSLGSLLIYNLVGNLQINYTSIEAGTHFNQTGLSIISFNQSNYNFSNTTFQAWANITVKQLFTNNTITSFNASNSGIANTTSTASLLLPANLGSQTIQVNVTGNYTRTFTCNLLNALVTNTCQATGIYDAVFTIGARNAAATSVLDFTIGVINNTLGGPIYNTSTTNGSILFNLLQGYYYNFSMNATGYALTSVINLSNNATQLYNFTLLTQNSFELYFKNETSDSILNNVNITVQVIGNAFAQNYTTGNGSLYVLLLTPDEYTIRYWYDSAVPRDYYVTLNAQSYENITLYLVDAGISQIYLPIIYNQFTRPIGDATVQLLRYFIGSNSYKVVEMATTDTNGQAVLRVVPNIINYKLLITSGNTSFTTDPTKFTASTNGYTLSDAQNVLTSIAGMPSVQKALSFNNATNTYIFTWTDTNNLVTSGCLYVDKYNNTGISQVKNTCEDGATGSIIYTITDTSNNTRYVASATINTNTEFSTYNFGPLTVEMGTATAAQIFGLTGFIILSILLVTVGFIANDHGNDTLIYVSLAGMLLIGIVGIVAYAWEAYIGIIIIGAYIAYKINK